MWPVGLVELSTFAELAPILCQIDGGGVKGLQSHGYLFKVLKCIHPHK